MDKQLIKTIVLYIIVMAFIGWIIYVGEKGSVEPEFIIDSLN